ncbi:50S ribosomal protein L15 [Candidatus Campbellbacteria bacterium]|nr:50S ribosomal protein L15 [Candidatus Campbellbacteria bacterium]|tara:strand:- start:147 stop:587 length:441 start_codon:yes stop_codon:yes gene_type:complete
MQMNSLKRANPNKKAKKVGRGGLRGKTSGRGHKGQKQHGSHGIRAEIRDQIKKLPKLRGRGKNSNKSVRAQAHGVNVAVLEAHFDAGSVVSKETLVEKGIISQAQARKQPIKILGNGDLSKKLTIEGCLVSQSAEEKITKAGGSVA